MIRSTFSGCVFPLMKRPSRHPTDADVEIQLNGRLQECPESCVHEFWQVFLATRQADFRLVSCRKSFLVVTLVLCVVARISKDHGSCI